MHVQSDTFLLADVFQNFRNKCIEIFELDMLAMLIPVQTINERIFCLHRTWAWQAGFKKTEIELELLTNKDMLLMVEKGTRGGIYQAIHRYAKVNNKYMKKYDTNTTSS